VKKNDSANVLDRLMGSSSRCFGRKSARALIELQADPVAQARIEELATKCNEGRLSDKERREYETYVHIGNLVAILQAKARLFLKQHPAA
jgi:hypothetical protein